MKTICLLFVLALAAGADPIYTVAGLGTLGGSTTGYAINSAGSVAGWSQNASGNQQAFVSGSTGVSALSSAASDAYAYGINNSGTVVGSTYVNGQSYGTIWTSSGTTQLGAGSYAMAINNSGEVVGGNGEAFVYDGGQMQMLGTAPGMDWSAAYGVDDEGIVVGDGQLANGSFRGIVWGADGSVTVLGTFGGLSSQATGVSDSGEVVGFASLASGYQNAFAIVNGAMVDLGTLGGGSSYAYGVNDSGEVVGYSWLADGDSSAFLYYNGTMLNLNSLIPSNSGWDLLEAYGINDSGQITGVGLYDGQLTGFLLTDPPASALASTPEPNGVILMGAALALIFFVKSRGYRLVRDAFGAGAATGSRGAPAGR